MKRTTILLLLTIVTCVLNAQQGEKVGIFDGHGDVGIFRKQSNMLSPAPATMFGSIMMSFSLYGRK